MECQSLRMQSRLCLLLRKTSHEYLGLGSGTDFENVLIYKENAAELLREEFGKRSWKGERVVFSGITDPYQPLESSLGLTRACLQVCEETGTPVSVITKGALVERDLSLLARIHRKEDALLIVSIPFFSTSVARKMEPGARSQKARGDSEPRRRSPHCGALSIIPGLNDMAVGYPYCRPQKRRALCHAFPVAIAGECGFRVSKPVAGELPERRTRILNQVQACRAGQTRPSDFHEE